MNQRLFQQRRADHKEAVQTILNFRDYVKQQKMVTIIAGKSFEVLEQNQVILREAGYIPGMDFPTDEEVRDALSQTLENTAFMGEVLLHLPDITHALLRDNKPWQLLFTWGIFFATQSKLLDKNSDKFMYLVSQELGIAEKDPAYTNPYSRSSQQGKGGSPPGTNQASSNKGKKVKKFKKGPQLSRQFGDL
ncbi:Coiled-coil domain-containing protein 134-like [Homarus americanus]|uniref:Coiled-coil domain-containing protein 134-like n=1 Tax=Homarus americanus TaxID=6706 RepID=A0A8J5MWH0_HOMAM|nr:Coiled-coil domain-containing protein 134-like [Homarus americanus]